MTQVFAIDPGPERSAWVVYGAIGQPECVAAHGIVENEELLEMLDSSMGDELAIEMIASYGMPVGREVFETCVFIGQVIERWHLARCAPTTMVYRKDVMLHLCGNARAKDSNIRAALMDRYGGSKAKAVGTKRQPGPLYGVRKDVWSALAVAVFYADTRGKNG